MAQPVATKTKTGKWSPRARLYGAALAITLSYLLIGRLTNDNDSWVQVSLPLSSASLLLVSLASAETYLHVQRIQKNQAELQAARAQEIELSQRLAFQRHSTLNQISRALIDKLDASRISTDVLEKIAQLFEADAVVAWLTEKNGQTRFLLKGAFGFTAHKLEQLEAIHWAFPGVRGIGTRHPTARHHQRSATIAASARPRVRPRTHGLRRSQPGRLPQ